MLSLHAKLVSNNVNLICVSTEKTNKQTKTSCLCEVQSYTDHFKVDLCITLLLLIGTQRLGRNSIRTRCLRASQWDTDKVISLPRYNEPWR